MYEVHNYNYDDSLLLQTEELNEATSMAQSAAADYDNFARFGEDWLARAKKRVVVIEVERWDEGEWNFEKSRVLYRGGE